MSLLEFRSPAAGGFFMMPETFASVCKVIDRPYAESGCWLPEYQAAIIEKLEAEVGREKVLLESIKKRERERELAGRRVFKSFEEEEQEEEENKKAKERVSFAMRVFPLLEMLRAAQKKQVKVMWGVPY